MAMHLRNKFGLEKSETKTKEGVFIGRDIHELMLDDEFKRELKPTESAAWAFVQVVQNFFGSHRAESYAELVENMLVSSSDLQVKHKKAVFEWIKGLEDEVPAADANWENGYTELVVGKRHRSCSAHSSLQHVADGNSLLWDETIRKLYKQISIHQIFEKDPRDDTQPCTVLLSGAAGIGKSTAVHKILFDWARDAQYKKFKYVFLFKFGELNLLEEEEAEMSLVRLIMRYYKHLNDSDLVMREILHMPESVLFIFDGLDEYKYQLNFAQRTLCLNPEAPYPVHILIISLLCGELLKKCSVLITSRPSALQSLYVDGFDRFAKVLGFFPEQQKMYIQKFFANTVQSNKAIKYVQQNAMLSSVVHIPFYCRVICCVLLDHFTVITGDKNAPLPQTNTELLVMFLYSILSCHSEEPEEKKCMLVKLGKMAYYGLSKKTSVFYEKYEISSYDLQSSLSCPANSDFLLEILKRENTLEHTAYKFLNVTMQEFMAACSFFLDPPEDIENLFVKLDSCENGDYDILTQFLAGLANLTVTEKLEGVLKEFQRKTAERILEWVKEKAQTALQGGDKNEQMKAFTCLAETQNKELIRDLIGKDFKLDYTPAALNPLYYSVLNTVISCCGEVEELKFSHSDMSLSALKQMLPGLSLCKRVMLGENGVSEVQKIILESLREELDQSGRHTCIYK
ncbi:NAL12 protein, partial [Polypterus senegalus]